MTSTPGFRHPPLHLVESPSARFPYTAGRADVAGLLRVLGATDLTGGNGFAYASSTDRVVTGSLSVVDEGTRSTSSAAADYLDVKDTANGVR